MTTAAVREQSFADFDRRLTEAAKRIPAERIVQAQRSITLEALKRIALRMPVDQGHARKNLQVTIGAPAQGVIPGDEKNVTAVVATAKGVLADLRPYTSTWITDNVPYVRVLEEGLYPNPSKKELRAAAVAVAGAAGGLSSDQLPKTVGGYSKQAQQGMFAVTVQELLKLPLLQDQRNSEAITPEI